MNHLQNLAKFTTKEEGLKALKEAVDLRDKMGGAMYWNMMNDDCVEIANKLRRIEGVTTEEISGILGEGTHTKPYAGR